MTSVTIILAWLILEHDQEKSAWAKNEAGGNEARQVGGGDWDTRFWSEKQWRTIMKWWCIYLRWFNNIDWLILILYIFNFNKLNQYEHLTESHKTLQSQTTHHFNSSTSLISLYSNRVWLTRASDVQEVMVTVTTIITTTRVWKPRPSSRSPHKQISTTRCQRRALSMRTSISGSLPDGLLTGMIFSRTTRLISGLLITGLQTHSCMLSSYNEV